MRDDLPRGTVTFLFTDVAGSTRLLRELGTERYAERLADHRAVIRDAVAGEGGVEVDTQGDAFFLAFPTADGAVRAARTIATRLDAGEIHVRAGVHTGMPLVVDEGYVGDDVHLAARIAAAGHGGQILVSEATRGLLGTSPDLIDLGEHRLKDFASPVRLHQVGSESFPPLRSIANTNLPNLVSSFLGRDDDIAAISDRLVAGDRLVTLSGPGGVGKTRLAIEAARRVAGRFSAGVWWVELAPIRDPQLVLPTIGASLGTEDELARHIGDREMLLVLDNLEQVAGVAPEIARLLQACPRLVVLGTSRLALHLTGEREVRIEPLPQDVAVELFVDRSGIARSPEIDELCRLLDAMPLAVELAASRTRTLGARAILDRLGGRLDLLKGGRDLDPRQQTLRSTIAWSDDLLDGDARSLFRGLSVFAGGCELETAETVLDADLDVLQTLVEHSLVRVTDGRFWMLETIRAYAVDAFVDDPRRAAVEARFASWAVDLVATQDALVRGPRQIEALAVLDREIDNVRAAFEILVAEGDPDRVRGLALAARWWLDRRGFGAEARSWLQTAIDLPGGEPGPLGWALVALAPLDGTPADIDTGRSMLERARRIGEQNGDGRLLGTALELLGYTEPGPSGLRKMQDAYAMFEELGLADERGRVAIDLSARLLNDGDDLGAAEAARTAVVLGRELGNRHGIGIALGNQAAGLALSGDVSDAEVALREAVAVFDEIGERNGFALLLEVAAVIEAAERPGPLVASFLGALEAGTDGLRVGAEPSDLRMQATAQAALAGLDPAAVEEARLAGRGQDAGLLVRRWLDDRGSGRSG